MKTQATLIALLIIFFFTGHSTFAQRNAQIGIKGGANFATLNTDDNDLRSSFVGGVFVSVPTSQNLTVQPELLFSSQGTRYEGSNDVTTLNYLSLPIMFKVYPVEGFSFEAGPQFSYLLSSETDFGALDVDNTGSLKEHDISAGFGIGYQSGSALLNVRYNLDLTDISENSNRNLKNRTVQVTLGFLF